MWCPESGGVLDCTDSSFLPRCLLIFYFVQTISIYNYADDNSLFTVALNER